jgi:hypothetical protein
MMATDPVTEMQAFIDEVREIAPLTVDTTPEGGVANVKIGATEKLVEVANSAEAHSLLLTYDGVQVIAVPQNPESAPTVSGPALPAQPEEPT